MLDVAFVSTAFGFQSSCASFASRTALKAPSAARVARHGVARMCENPTSTRDKVAVTDESLSAAEKTRRALSESKPLVKFRRDPEYLDQRTDRVYAKGAEGVVDIWVITGILTLLVPLVGFAIGVATGNIDINPR